MSKYSKKAKKIKMAQWVKEFNRPKPSKGKKVKKRL